MEPGTTPGRPLVRDSFVTNFRESYSYCSDYRCLFWILQSWLYVFVSCAVRPTVFEPTLLSLVAGEWCSIFYACDEPN